MDTDRREFLKVTGGVVVSHAGLARSPQACAVIDGNKLGRIVYCRVSHRSVPEAVASIRRLFDGESPIALTDRTLRYRTFIASYEQGEDRVVICGSDATLVVAATGCERFA